MAEIVQAVEGGVALTDCCRDDNHCDVMHACTVQTNWTVINQTVNTLFSRITLSDMTRPLTSRDLMQKIQGEPSRTGSPGTLILQGFTTVV